MNRHKRTEEAKRKQDHYRKQLPPLKTSEQGKRVGVGEPRSSAEDSAELRCRSCIESMASLVLGPQEFGTEPSELGLRALRRGTDWLVLFLKGIHQTGSRKWENVLSYCCRQGSEPSLDSLGGKQATQEGCILLPPLIAL